MLVKESEFKNYFNIQIVSNTEEGLFAVEYEPQQPLGEAKIERDSYSWRYGSNNEVFSLIVPKPVPRNVLRTLIVRRTSANNYLAVYADLKHCGSANCKTLTEVHAFLEKYWTRSKY